MMGRTDLWRKLAKLKSFPKEKTKILANFLFIYKVFQVFR